MQVHLTLYLIGSDDEPRWAADVRASGHVTRHSDGQYCCGQGHTTPEEAASHGSALAATWLSSYARSLKPPACGALALQKAA